MWTILDLMISLTGVLLAFGVLMVSVRMFWPERAKYDAPEIYPLGDATETPTVLRNTRRANWRG